jgi:GNAT superfamily N-acetyltransferase
VTKLADPAKRQKQKPMGPPAKLRIVRLTQSRTSEAAIVAARAFADITLASGIKKDFHFSFSTHPYKPTTFVAVLDGNVVGTVQCMQLHINWRTYGVAWLAVHPDYWDLGIGRALLTHVEGHVRKLSKGESSSIVLADSAGKLSRRRRNFYLKLGYAQGPVLHNNEPIMVKNLEGLA